MDDPGGRGPLSVSAQPMRVVSVTVGVPRTVRCNGREVTTGIFKEPVGGRVPIRRLNLDGDGQADLAVHGGAAKAVYAYPRAHYAFWRTELDEDLGFGAFGENLTVEGLPLESEVAVGDRFRVGSAERSSDSPASTPCRSSGGAISQSGSTERCASSVEPHE